ncbi:hypothetical protein BRD17_01525 [Halobacteriales archaeon SW_7_68_16]|nr:MAG: hypothetical protein BRD17_01525 [Halobacteriales archaeon SW_7_68_16]
MQVTQFKYVATALSISEPRGSLAGDGGERAVTASPVVNRGLVLAAAATTVMMALVLVRGAVFPAVPPWMPLVPFLAFSMIGGVYYLLMDRDRQLLWYYRDGVDEEVVADSDD